MWWRSRPQAEFRLLKSGTASGFRTIFAPISENSTERMEIRIVRHSTNFQRQYNSASDLPLMAIGSKLGKS
jgi:hypothetical protein